MENLLSQLKHKQPLEDHISYQLADKFKERMQPFMDEMGLAFFSIHIFNEKGDFTMLYTDRGVEQILYDPSMHHIGVFRTALNRYSELKQGLTKEALKQLSDKHNISFGLSYITKLANEYHVSHAAISENTSTQSANLIFQPDILLYTRNYALENCADLIAQAKTQYLEFPLNTPTKIAKHLCQHWKTVMQKRFNFHKKICNNKATFRYKDHFSRLSTREFECYLLLLNRNTNKEIASKMTVSVKHIERTIAKIKTKLGCYSRDQLIEAAYYNGLIEGCQAHYADPRGGLNESWTTLTQ